MNELMYSLLNQIEDVNKTKEITLEEFIKLVKSNQLISEDDAKTLIESYKKMVNAKTDSNTDNNDSEDSEERRKRYKQKYQSNQISKQYPEDSVNKKDSIEEKDEKSIERE